MLSLPKWTRDELVLAVDYYISIGEVLPSRSDPALQALSELLRDLPIHQPKPTDHRFRNLNGVYRKLCDIHSSRPDYVLRSGQPGKKTRGNKLDFEVLSAFQSDPVWYAAEAEQIRSIGSNDRLANSSPNDVDDVETGSDEGSLLLRRHFGRERDTTKAREKKEAVLQKTGCLTCEACGFDFFERYGERGYGYIECHHRIPLSESGPTQTRLEDLALVCSNCHRMIHRRRKDWLSVEELKLLLAQTPVGSP
jgi:5-methylcytosine-specific restriction protein A